MKSPFHSTRNRIALVAGIVVLVGVGLAAGSRADAGSPTPATQTEEPTAVATVAPPTTVIPTTTTTVVDSSLFVNNVNTFYSRWIKSDSTADKRDAVNEYLVKPYGGTLNGSSVDYDQVLCAQNIPLKFQVGTPVFNGNNVTVKLTTYWSDGPRSFSVTGDAISGLITNISCPNL